MKKRSFSFLFIIFLLLSFSYCQAQDDYIPPSPQAMSIVGTSGSDVNLYNGQTSITVPIHTVKDRSLKIDIALAYNSASGVRVQDIAGSAGLGWSLLAGGVITRTVRGGPDELNSQSTPGYLTNTRAQNLTSDPNSNNFKNVFIGDNNQDFEPDVFTSSVGGRIIFSPSKTPYFIDNEGYKIDQNGLFSRDSTWVIKDKQGNIYLFGKNASEREHSVFLDQGAGTSTAYTSSWYLSEIHSFDGSSITFQYTKENRVTYEYYQRNKIRGLETWPFPFDYPDSTVNVQIEDPLYLKKIIASNETAVLDYSDRLDFPGAKALASISILDGNQNFKTKYTFETDYFKSNDPNPELRLKLTAVKQLNNLQSQSNLIARFTYNETSNLPSRHSAAFDAWGYYNNNNTGAYFISNGAIKTSDPTRIKSNILTQIQWPTGGLTQYEYQLNTYRKDNQDYSGAGLGISAIKQINIDGQALTTSYSYINSSGYTSGLLNSDLNSINGYTMSYKLSATVGSIGYGANVTKETDVPVSKLTDVNNIPIGYSMVTIIHPDNSKEINYFNGYDEFPDVINNYFDYGTSYFYGFHPEYASKYNGFSSFTSAHLNRGLLKQIDILNSANQLQERTNYEYNMSYDAKIPGSQRIYLGSQSSDGQTGSWSSNYFTGSLYFENVTTPTLTKTIKDEYNTADNTVINSTIVKNLYKDAPWPFLLGRQSKTQSDGTTINTNFTYASDIVIPNTPLMPWYLYSANILTPLETVSSITRGSTEQVTGAKIVTYQDNGTLILPYQQLTLKINAPISDYQKLSANYTYDSRFKADMINSIYHIDGQLLQYAKSDGIPVSTLWGYNKQYPIAKVINATKDQIAYANCEEQLDGDDEINNTNLYFSDNTLLSNDSKTGKKSYRLVDGQYIETVFKLPPATYIVSYWSKGGKITFDDGISLSNTIDRSPDANGWAYHEVTAKVNSSDYFEIYGDQSNPSILVDDIRIYPQGAQMTTYTYDPTCGATSQTDANGIITYYEYDSFNRLLNIKDQKGNILKNFQYNTVGN